jgi:hypothetical protein
MIYVVTEEIVPILFPTCMTSASVNLIEHSIIWWCKKGATIEERLHWLESNNECKINEIGNIHLAGNL